MQVTSRSRGPAQILDLEGPLDMEGAALLKDRLHALLRSGARRVLLNLERVPVMDSSGLGALVSLHISFRDQQAALAVFSPPIMVRNVLEATNLEDFVPIMNSEEEALALFE